MLDVFKKYITDKVVLSETEWSQIEAVCSLKKLRKHQFLLQEGDIWRTHAFICQGCLRRYGIDDNGIEHTIQFSIENWWAGDRESLMSGTPSKYNIDAIEDSTVVLIKNNEFETLCKLIPAFNDLINNILFKSLNASQERIHASISLSAEEKYLHFIKNSPDIAARIPRHMMASYLGITPETLSRIRKQVTNK